MVIDFNGVVVKVERNMVTQDVNVGVASMHHRSGWRMTVTHSSWS